MKRRLLDKRLQSERRKEVRKEKSKEAARCRRGKEGEVFTDLIDMLPIPDSIKSSLDKTSIIRLCLNFIRTRDLLHNVCSFEVTDEYDTNVSIGSLFETSHNVMLLLSAAGDITFITENVKPILGICQYDVVGYGLDTLVHPSDWTEVEQQIESAASSLSFTVRLKCSLSLRAKFASAKSVPYKTVRFSGRRLIADQKPSAGSAPPECLILTAVPVDLPLQVDQPLDSMTFTSKHDLDMTFTECDPLVKDLCMYPESYVTGKLLYDFVHPCDIKSTAQHFKSLLSKEHIMTDRYKFLTAGGGYTWVVTHASLVRDMKVSPKPQHVLCVHQVLSSVEESEAVMANIQLTDSLMSCVKVEASVPQYCDVDKPSPDESDDYEYENIFESTADVFVDADESTVNTDFMHMTGQMFDQSSAMDNDISAITAGVFSDINVESLATESTDFEALVAELDNDSVDVNKGLFVDLANLSDKEFYMRAPYIPMDENAQLPLTDGFCSADSLAPADSKVDKEWSGYRLTGDNERNGFPSPIQSSDSAYSPGCTTDSSFSPATEQLPLSPWPLELERVAPFSDHSTLPDRPSYTPHLDHSSYNINPGGDTLGEDAHSSNNINPGGEALGEDQRSPTFDMDSYLQEHLTVTDGMQQTPPPLDLSYSDEPLLTFSDTERDVSSLPGRLSRSGYQSSHSPAGETLYTRQLKRKADASYTRTDTERVLSSASTQQRHLRDQATNTVYKPSSALPAAGNRPNPVERPTDSGPPVQSGGRSTNHPAELPETDLRWFGRDRPNQGDATPTLHLLLTGSKAKKTCNDPSGGPKGFRSIQSTDFTASGRKAVDTVLYMPTATPVERSVSRDRDKSALQWRRAL